MSLRARRPRRQARRHDAPPLSGRSGPARLASVVPPKSAANTDDIAARGRGGSVGRRGSGPRLFGGAPPRAPGEQPARRRPLGRSCRDRGPAYRPGGQRSLDANGDRRRPSGPFPPGASFPEVDQVGELERILAARPQSFRLQFFGVATELGPTILSECELRAADATSAIRAAADAAWPPQAIGLRIVDAEGREDFRAASGRSLRLFSPCPLAADWTEPAS